MEENEQYRLTLEFCVATQQAFTHPAELSAAVSSLRITVGGITDRSFAGIDIYHLGKEKPGFLHLFMHGFGRIHMLLCDKIKTVFEVN